MRSKFSAIGVEKINQKEGNIHKTFQTVKPTAQCLLPPRKIVC